MYDFAFKQIRNILGGSVKFMFTGSAPASPEVLKYENSSYFFL
jgi:long-subunit acyl-CoA synthetase (AMP-forming)